MWGTSIVGFGPYVYRARSAGTESEWFKVGFSPRKQSLVIYIMGGLAEYEDLLARLGRHTTGKACLYIKDLEQVDVNVLTELIERSVAHFGQKPS